MSAPTENAEGKAPMLKRNRSKKRQIARKAVTRTEDEITGSRRRAGGRSAAAVIEGMGRKLAENAALQANGPLALHEVQS
jgi:hypothetical protein